ncbi:hypothetical protein SYN65AY640_06325 [Synechococcus sp. 65AY640]|nr:hypothetical protein SYN65AY640_06325 [Synechococcus sp. 65AY640]
MESLRSRNSGVSFAGRLASNAEPRRREIFCAGGMR